MSAVENPRVRGIQERLVQVVEGTRDVAGPLRDKAKYVGAYVVSAKSMELPVGFHSRNIGIVIVECGVLCTHEGTGNCVTEKHIVDTVLQPTTTVLVKC